MILEIAAGLGRRVMAEADSDDARIDRAFVLALAREPGERERSIAELDSVIINGGARGCLVKLAANDLVTATQPTLVDVAR